MTPFRFGPAARQLYGVVHPAVPSASGGTAVLLCNPLGQEAVRVHRLQRILCDRLAARGIWAMRFDAFGTGEASGDDEDGDLLGWVEDVQRAHVELLRRSRAARVVWVGARLGGTLAALASGRVEAPVARLVLWEPISDGPGYLAELAQAHAGAMAEAAGRAHADRPRALEREVIGFGISQPLLQQLAALEPAQVAQARAGDVAILASRSRPPAAALVHGFEAQGLHVRTNVLDYDFDWLTEEAMSTALVPAPVLEALAAHIEGGAHA